MLIAQAMSFGTSIPKNYIFAHHVKTIGMFRTEVALKLEHLHLVPSLLDPQHVVFWTIAFQGTDSCKQVFAEGNTLELQFVNLEELEMTRSSIVF